jgi:hypothetical protein
VDGKMSRGVDGLIEAAAMGFGYLHQQTSLTTSTVTDDDELPTDLRHTVGVKWFVEGVGDGVM